MAKSFPSRTASEAITSEDNSLEGNESYKIENNSKNNNYNKNSNKDDIKSFNDNILTEEELDELWPDRKEQKELPRPLPSRREALQLLRKLHVPYHIINHLLAVMRIARDIAHDIVHARVNIELVRIGALLHDIGRAKTHGLDHAIVGGKILRELGYSEELARIAETHTLGGLTSEEAKELGLPPIDLQPVSLEEKIVCLADKLVTGTKKVSIDERFQRWIQRYGDTPMLRRQVARVKMIDDEILHLIYQ